MPKTVLTLRIEETLLRRVDARAARTGLNRAAYLRGLIEQDLDATARAEPARFVSEDLAGIYGGPAESATNERARRNLRERSAR